MRKLIVSLCSLFSAFALTAQVNQYSGVVLDDAGMPLPGSAVVVKGTATAASSDYEGKFAIEANSTDTLVVSFMGFEDYLLPLSTLAVGGDITIKLSEAKGQDLDEVVVVGYGTTTKKSFTGTAVTVEPANIMSKSTSSVTQALVGEVAGVRVVTTTGQPGTTPDIYIRGIGSINGNTAPLYVVDGVPFQGTITSINNADIKNLSILKDATATAIYGSRGANGVVLITTKSGVAGKSSIDVELKSGYNFDFLPRYELNRDPDQYIERSYESLVNFYIYSEGKSRADAQKEANKQIFAEKGVGIVNDYNFYDTSKSATGGLIDPETGKIANGVTKKYTPGDWLDYATQEAKRQEANIKLQGGSQELRFFTSIGYLKDEGYAIASDYERITGRLNVNHNVYDWLTGSMTVGIAYSESVADGQTQSSGNILYVAEGMPPIYDIFKRDEEGKKIKDPFNPARYVYDFGARRNNSNTNAIAQALLNADKDESTEINISKDLKVELLENLFLEGRAGFQYRNRQGYDMGSRYYGFNAATGGYLGRRNRTYTTLNLQQILRYSISFDDHTINAMAAHETNTYQFKDFFADKTRLFNPNNYELDNAVTIGSASSYTDMDNLESYFGQLNYDFQKRYFLSFTFRRDGSSRFLNNKWGTFGSVGGSWIVSEESFFPKGVGIDNLKLKTSYGILGDRGDNDEFNPGVNQYDLSESNGKISLQLNEIGNPDLTWEESKMLQVGFESKLFGILNWNFDYYYKKTDDMLFDRRVPPSSGIAIITVNDGSIINQGYESDLSANFKFTDDVSMRVATNIEFPMNEITAMPIDPSTGEQKVIDINGRFGRAVGHSVYDYYIQEYRGVDPLNGQPLWTMYYDDKDGNGKYNTGDRKITSLHEYEPTVARENKEALAKDENAKVHTPKIEKTTTNSYSNATTHFVGLSALPDVRGAFNLGFDVYGVTLSAQFIYQLGGYGYDNKYSRYMNNGLVGSDNHHVDIEGRWKKPGDITDIPKISNQSDNNVDDLSTRFLISSDYLALNNVRIGYNIPSSILETIGLVGVNVYASADNLWLTSARVGYNPTQSITGFSSWYTYNTLTNVSFGLNIKI